MAHLPNRILVTATSLGLLAGASAGQSLISMDTAGNLVGFNSPAAGPCAAPLGPLLQLSSYTDGAPPPCPDPLGALSPLPSHLGDMSVNRRSNLLWMTDGSIISEQQTAGGGAFSFNLPVGTVLPGPITGLGYDPVDEALWITDGDMFAEIVPPPVQDCTLPVGVLVQPQPLPIAANATATDIEWDPLTQSLWVCDDTGMVTNMTIGGQLTGFGTFDAVSNAPCALGELQSLAVDTASLSAGVLYVTDGTTVFYVQAPTGNQATLNFYTTQPCFPAPPEAAELGAIGFMATGNFYGSASGGFFPVIGTGGKQSVIPNANFSLQMAGFGVVDTGDISILAVSFQPLCPGIPFGGGNTAHILPPGVTLGVQVVGDPPLVDFPVPLNASAPVGLPLFFQAFNIEFDSLLLSNTRGLAMTVALP